MLRDRTPAVLVLEADAGWDLHVRQIMSTLSGHLAQFLRDLGSAPLPSSRWSAAPARDPRPGPAVAPDPDDPWLSRHWDVLSLGQCHEDVPDDGLNYTYPDPHVVPEFDNHGRVLGSQRVIRRSHGVVCTTAYAISQSGAAKLLARTALDLDMPVDLIMQTMTRRGQLVTYSVMPVVMAQMAYLEGIGMDGRESDINGDAQYPDEQTDMKGWDVVYKTSSVWRYKSEEQYNAFKEPALAAAWKQIFGNTSLH